MNYPVWDVPFLGGGLVVAIIAIIHILISHLAIGGGAFLFIAEIWAGKQANGKSIREWLGKYARYFLVYTTIFGAITGVGIWFSIQLANPEATSLLIHQFVFVWATEWVMFLGELTTLYLYYYGIGKNSHDMQVFLAGAYFVIAWFSLFLINGILSFMLTPDGWTLSNPDIYAGFFNPGFLPSLLIRTLVMFMLGGIFGIIVATRVKENGEFKKKIINFSAKWVIPAAIAVPFLLLWYWSTLPESAVALVKGGTVGVAGGKLEVITRYFWLALISGGLIMVGVIIATLRPQAVSTGGAIAIFLIAQFGILGAEFFREMSRKPYVVYGVLYSNGLWKKNTANKNYMKKSYLESSRWDSPVEPLSLQHGGTVFRLQCVSCHTRDGYRSIDSRTASWSGAFGYRWLSTMNETGVMPPFQGSDEDRAALSAYLISAHGLTTTAQEILDSARVEDSTRVADSIKVAVPPVEKKENSGGSNE